MAKQIKIRIFPDGTIESETFGIKGKSCLDYIKDIENLAEAKVIKSEFTSEYYQCSTQEQVVNEVNQHNAN